MPDRTGSTPPGPNLSGPISHGAAAIVLLGAIAAVLLMRDKSLAVLVLLAAIIICRLLILGPREPSEMNRDRTDEG